MRLGTLRYGGLFGARASVQASYLLAPTARIDIRADTNHSPLAMGRRPGAVARLLGLVRAVGDALNQIPGWLWGPAVFGWPRPRWPAPFSEYGLFVSCDVSRTLKFLGHVLIPSLPRRAPWLVPHALRSIFFHRTRILEHPGPGGDAPSGEHWFFINGILTDQIMAGLNAAYLVKLFRRPLTIIQNATDGATFDLAECAEEKAFGMNGEPVDVGFPYVDKALKDPDTDLVVIVAHSQGALISAVMLRLLRLIYAPDGRRWLTRQQLETELNELRRNGGHAESPPFRRHHGRGAGKARGLLLRELRDNDAACRSAAAPPVDRELR